MRVEEADELVWGESEHVSPIFCRLCPGESVLSCEPENVSVPPKRFWVGEAHGKGVNLFLSVWPPTDEVAFLSDVASFFIGLSLCPEV